MVIPDALRHMRLKEFRNYCVLGEMLTQCGWKYADLVGRLEEKRKTRSAAYYQRK